MRQRFSAWFVWVMIVGGTWCLPSKAEALEPLRPETRPLAMGSRVSVWPGHRGISPPAVVYPYVYIYPSPAPPSPQPAVQPYGYLRLEVRPAEAEIYVDGGFVGRGQDLTTGPAVVSVSPGGHVVEFRWQNSGTQIRLFVGEGETVEIKRDLGPMNPPASTPSSKRWATPSRVGGY